MEGYLGEAGGLYYAADIAVAGGVFVDDDIVDLSQGDGSHHYHHVPSSFAVVVVVVANYWDDCKKHYHRKDAYYNQVVEVHYLPSSVA